MLSAKVFKRFGIAFSIAAIASLVPFSVPSTGSATVKDACADITCCRELGSFCGTYLDHYTSLSGYCRIKGFDTSSTSNATADA